MMDMLVTGNPLYAQATRAYEDFEKRKIPFAAVKLNISLQTTASKEVDALVEDNFRSEKDLIFINADGYIILMKDTTMEAAERALNRLKDRLGFLTRGGDGFKDNKRIHASAYILGSCQATKSIQTKYLDLSPHLNFKNSTDTLQFNFKEYLRWLESSKNTDSQANQGIDIVV